MKIHRNRSDTVGGDTGSMLGGWLRDWHDRGNHHESRAIALWNRETGSTDRGACCQRDANLIRFTAAVPKLPGCRVPQGTSHVLVKRQASYCEMTLTDD